MVTNCKKHLHNVLLPEYKAYKVVPVIEPVIKQTILRTKTLFYDGNQF